MVEDSWVVKDAGEVEAETGEAGAPPRSACSVLVAATGFTATLHLLLLVATSGSNADADTATATATAAATATATTIAAATAGEVGEAGAGKEATEGSEVVGKAAEDPQAPRLRHTHRSRRVPAAATDLAPGAPASGTDCGFLWMTTVPRGYRNDQCDVARAEVRVGWGVRAEEWWSLRRKILYFCHVQ